MGEEKLIYCVEDEESIRDLVVYALENSGFKAEGFETAKEFYRALEEKNPDLILLDIMLPIEDGYKVLEKLKSRNSSKEIPVIMLTAKSNEFDKVKGLDMGADDYISKPFGVMELISRVNAVLRRTNTVKDSLKTIKFEEIVMDLARRTVYVAGKEVNLTFKEFELLEFLIENEGIVLSRDKIMNRVWDTFFEGESRTVDVHIRTLRLKLGEYGKYIETIRNVGYKIGK
mgnify:CR=1 FL=1